MGKIVTENQTELLRFAIQRQILNVFPEPIKSSSNMMMRVVKDQ